MILSLLISTAFAGTMQLNGKPCGEMTSLSVDKLGNVSAQSSQDCGGALPTPPPAPVPPPPACPPSTICFDKGWPVIPQAVYSMKQGQVMSFKIKTDSVVKSGRIYTMITTGDTASRQIAISKIAGSFEPVMARCVASGFEAVSLSWSQGGTALRTCLLPLDSELYINVKFTNCEEGKMCKYYFGSN